MLSSYEDGGLDLALGPSRTSNYLVTFSTELLSPIIIFSDIYYIWIIVITRTQANGLKRFSNLQRICVFALSSRGRRRNLKTRKKRTKRRANTVA